MRAAWARLESRVRRWFTGRHVPIFYHAAYRLPFATIEANTGVEPRRADMALAWLMQHGVVVPADLRKPTRIRYEDLARVHTHAWLEALEDARELARVFAVDPSDIVVDEVVQTVRLACGATLEAARASLSRRASSLNLLGGFHHAGPARGGGFCLLNDIAVAIAALRAEGFSKSVVVIDLDAHPPDGTAECFRGDDRVWIGSISCADWGKLEGVDETVLPAGTDDATYLAALRELVGRIPDSGLAFVIAGGDVLAGDRFGSFGMSLDGVRQRDLMVERALAAVPSVWLPGGGYTPKAWRVLAGSVLVLDRQSLTPIPLDADPMTTRFINVARELTRERLEGSAFITEADLMADLDRRGGKTHRFLDFYTTEGIELAFSQYGILGHLRRLGYSEFRVAIDRDDRGDRFRLFACAERVEHLIVECVLEKRIVAGEPVLYVHWLTLRDPRGRFSSERPRLPGQDVPGLGLSREAGQLLVRTAERLGLSGLAFRPAWLHTAYPARAAMHFVDPGEQGRFEALLRDLGHVPLLELTSAVAEERVRMNGSVYKWEAGEMVHWLDRRPLDRGPIEAEMARVKFSLERVKE